MKRFLPASLVALVAVLTVIGCATPGAAALRVHSTAVRLVMDDGLCSGTVIGPGAILSATHCFVGAHPMTVRTATSATREAGRNRFMAASADGWVVGAILLPYRRCAQLLRNRGHATGEADRSDDDGVDHAENRDDAPQAEDAGGENQKHEDEPHDLTPSLTMRCTAPWLTRSWCLISISSAIRRALMPASDASWMVQMASCCAGSGSSTACLPAPTLR